MTFLSILMLAILVEAIIEHLGQPIPSEAKPFFAAALAVGLCLAYNADLLAALGLESRWWLVGPTVTGIIVGRGSNYLNDMWSRLRVLTVPATTVDRVIEREEPTK